MAIFSNFPLWCAIAAIVLAQFLKVPVNFIATKKWDWRLINSSGGMPSSHSGGVTALATGIAIEEGLSSPIFAVATVLAIIVMYDATGVRRQTGKQSIAINTLMRDFNRFIEEAKTWAGKDKLQKREELKELLGHEPSEVFVGGLFGVCSTLIIYSLITL